MLGALPHPGTLNFDYKEVEFHFDEFIKPGNYRDEVFISPVPPEDPSITVKNKVLRIKFASELKENTTYVVTLGTGIADWTESNKMKKSYTYAFSTGAVLDSMRVTGRVEDMWSGNGEKEMKVMLFKAEDVPENDFVGKRPEYLSVTDKEGKFSFDYLAPGRYKVIGVADLDNNTKLSGYGEKIALAPSMDLELVGGDSIVPNLSLTAFYVDNKGPKLKSAKWSNDYTIHLEFSEPVRLDYLESNLQVELTDTTGSNGIAAGVIRQNLADPKHIYVHAGKPRDRDYGIRLTNLMDTLGQRSDTLARLTKDSQVREEKGKWYESPVNQRVEHLFSMNTMFQLPDHIDTSMVIVRDSNKRYVPIQWSADGMTLFGRPDGLLDPKMPYVLLLRKGMLLPDGKPVDTTLGFRLSFPNPDDFGSLSGKVLPDSTRPGTGFIAVLRGSSGSGLLVRSTASEKGGKSKPTPSSIPDRFEARFAAPASFRYIYLVPGKYNVDIIEDTDGNGVLTPGSIIPYRLPEKVYHQSTPFEIKAKWDMENVQVYPIPPVGGKGKEGKIGSGDKELPKGK